MRTRETVRGRARELAASFLEGEPETNEGWLFSVEQLRQQMHHLIGVEPQVAALLEEEAEQLQRSSGAIAQLMTDAPSPR